MFLLLAVNFLALHLIDASCPNNTIASYTDKTLCYSFQTTQLKYMEAQGVCSGMNGNLVSIHNMFENVFTSEEAETLFTQSTVDDFWIGANNLLSPNNWTWIDNSGEYWQDAEQRCKIDGGHLVSIHSLDEDLYVTHLVNSRKLYGAWIGLYTEDNNQNWKWTDGTPFDYKNWLGGYPINTGQQSVVEIVTNRPNGQTGNWINAAIRGSKNTFICKTSPT